MFTTLPTGGHGFNLSSLITGGLGFLAEQTSVIIQAITRTFKRTGFNQTFSIAKQPSEKYVGYGVDFSGFLANSEVVSGVVVSSPSETLIISNVWYNNEAAYCSIAGGVNGEQTKITYKAFGSKGTVLENDMQVIVVDT